MSGFSGPLVRERLLANRAYYVRTDGVDTNDGRANTSGGAFLTIPKAVDTVAKLDTNGFTVTIQVADGTYTGSVFLRNVVGAEIAGSLIIQGNNSTPSNVLISTTSNSAFSANAIQSVWDVRDLKVQTTTSGYGILATLGAAVRYQNIDFGACANSQVAAFLGGRALETGVGAISGNAPSHWFAAQSGIIDTDFAAFTLTGTPAFATAFAVSQTNALIQCAAMTFSGSATGARYSTSGNGLINTGGGGASYLPGNSAGSGSGYL
ncbi:MAG: hypothetical protein J0H94_03865 [Rhizobiales bacterium]|nr:hypothetical protein [Hyphomicrobiales bacterium]